MVNTETCELMSKTNRFFPDSSQCHIIGVVLSVLFCHWATMELYLYCFGFLLIVFDVSSLNCDQHTNDIACIIQRIRKSPLVLADYMKSEGSTHVRYNFWFSHFISYVIFSVNPMFERKPFRNTIQSIWYCMTFVWNFWLLLNDIYQNRC